MATKKNTMEITPLMGLSMLALVVMMPVIFFISNSNKSTQKSYAAQPTPTPTGTPIGIN